MRNYHRNLDIAKREIGKYMSGEAYNQLELEKIGKFYRDNELGGTKLETLLNLFSQLNSRTSLPNNCCFETMKLTKEITDII